MAAEPASAGRLVARVDPQRCLGCGQCLPSCPRGLLAVRDGLAVVIETARCDGRGHCLGHCSADALNLGPCCGLDDSA
jgi:heterodisulfide reductase subunit A-like polyferredoxin